MRIDINRTERRRRSLLPEVQKTTFAMEQTNQQARYVNLMADSGFKAVFADKENKKLLICLLNHLLPEDAKVNDIVSYEDRERSAMTIYGKKTSLDLICKGNDGELVQELHKKTM